MSQKGWQERIFEEKRLWEVYWLSQKVLPKPKSNRAVFWCFVGLFSCLFVWGIYDAGTHYSMQEALKFLRYAASQGLALSIGILGFLIAGFAIFASVTRAELFITLANIPYKDTGINRLQFVFFNFINVFTVYIGLLAFCMFIALGFAENSPLAPLSNRLADWCPKLPIVGLLALLGVLGLWLVAALLKLKSFVWNLYQTVLVSIATEAEMLERQNQDRP